MQAGGRRFDPVQLHHSGVRSQRTEASAIAVAARGSAGVVVVGWTLSIACCGGVSIVAPGRGQAREAARLFNNSEGKAFVDSMRVRGCLG